MSRLRKRPLGRYRYVRLRWRVLFAVIDSLGALGFGLIRWLRRSARRAVAGQPAPPPKNPDDPRAILLVQLDHLGDAIITSVMLPPLRRRYPHASIEVLAGPWNRELFEAMPEVDRVHVSRVNRFARGCRFGWILSTFWSGYRLRRRKFDLAIDVRGEFPLALILWLSGARRRLGWNCGGGGFLLTDTPRFVPDRPEAESRLALLAELGIQPDASGEARRPTFHPTEQSRRRVARRLAESAWEEPSEGPRIVLHVGAGTPAKGWPAESWQELVGRLVVRLGARIVLVGGPRDRAVARRILGRRAWPDLADCTGRLDVVELAALLEQADLVVGADSGPAHLAAAVGAPVVVLFSGTNRPRQWQPCGEHVRVLQHRVDCSPCNRRKCPWSDHPCMRRLTPRRVAEAVERLHRETSRRVRQEIPGAEDPFVVTRFIGSPHPNTEKTA